ncbi:MAG: HNH endonuclease [Bacteroidota bacterium]
MDPLDFFKKYKLIATTENLQNNSSTPRVCRFCGNDETKNTFNSDTHIIPELLGENDFIHFEECDKCNSKFSGFESHLAILFRPYLTMVGVKGKHRVPEFQSRTLEKNENTRTIIKHKDNKIRYVFTSQKNDFLIDDENKKGSITFRLPPHKPILVYKSLVKIALTLLPKTEVSKYKNIFYWLSDSLNKDTHFPFAFVSILLGSKFSIPFAELYKTKRTIYKYHFLPELTLIIRFGNIVLQIFLPLSNEFNFEKSHLKSPTLNLYPSYIWDEYKSITQFTFNQINLSRCTSVSYDETIHFAYAKADLNINLQSI